MGDLVQVGDTGELADGTMKSVLVKGREILLARVADAYYAADNRCPRHGSQFDLTDGRVVRWLKGSGLLSKVGKALKSPRPLATYNVKVEGDRILIEI